MQADKIYRQQIEAHAKTNGLALLKIFEDIDFSGRKGSKPRPQFLEMLALAESGGFDSLIVPKLSRFGRSMKDNVAAYDRLEDAGVDMFFLDLQMDTTSSAGRLMRYQMTALAEYESDLISERWKDTHQYLAQKGIPNGAVAFGFTYDKIEKELRPDPRRAPVVQEVFRRFAYGETLRSIALDLDARGITGPSGSARRWTASHIARMLDNPSYGGFRQIGWWKGLEGERFEGKWDRLVDPVIFDQVQKLRAATKARTPAARRRGHGKHLLSGLLHCRCGAPMWRNSRADEKRSVYDCSHSKVKRRGDCSEGTIYAQRVEVDVAAQFLNTISGDYMKAALKAPSKLFQPGVRKAVRPAASEIEAIEENITSLVNDFVDASPSTRRIIQNKIAELSEKQEALRQQQAVTDATQLRQRQTVSDLKELRRRIGDLSVIWDAATTTERKEMLTLAIERVDVVTGEPPKRIRIMWADWVVAAQKRK